MDFLDLPRDVLARVVNHPVLESEDQARLAQTCANVRAAVRFTRVQVGCDAIDALRAALVACDGGCEELEVFGRLTEHLCSLAKARPSLLARLRLLRTQVDLPAAQVDVLFARLPALREILVTDMANNPSPRVDRRVVRTNVRLILGRADQPWAIGAWNLTHLCVSGRASAGDLGALAAARDAGLRARRLIIEGFPDLVFADGEAGLREFVAIAVALADEIALPQYESAASNALASALARTDVRAVWTPPGMLKELERGGPRLRRLTTSLAFYRVEKETVDDALQALQRLVANRVRDLWILTGFDGAALARVLVGAEALAALDVACSFATLFEALRPPGAAPNLRTLRVSVREADDETVVDPLVTHLVDRRERGALRAIEFPAGQVALRVLDRLRRAKICVCEIKN